MPIPQLELLVKSLADGSGWELSAPSVGLWTNAPEKGEHIDSSTDIGVLLILERAWTLKVPKDVEGFVDSEPPERKHRPMEYGEPMLRVLREGKPIHASQDTIPSAMEDQGGLYLRAPQAGRFYRRPDPESPLYAEEGDEIFSGRTIGLLEVMKTFNPVKYVSDSDLPEKATIDKFLARDGEDVQEGQPLLSLS